jgi:hypothetical protein
LRSRTAFPSLWYNRGRERELLPYHNSIKQMLLAWEHRENLRAHSAP